MSRTRTWRSPSTRCDVVAPPRGRRGSRVKTTFSQAPELRRHGSNSFKTGALLEYGTVPGCPYIRLSTETKNPTLVCRLGLGEEARICACFVDESPALSLYKNLGVLQIQCTMAWGQTLARLGITPETPSYAFSWRGLHPTEPHFGSNSQL